MPISRISERYPYDTNLKRDVRGGYLHLPPRHLTLLSSHRIQGLNLRIHSLARNPSVSRALNGPTSRVNSPRIIPKSQLEENWGCVSRLSTSVALPQY